MDLIYELLLFNVNKNCTLTVCLLHEIQGIETSWLRGMTDFNRICDRVFDTAERLAAADAQSNDCCIQ